MVEFGSCLQAGPWICLGPFFSFGGCQAAPRFRPPVKSSVFVCLPPELATESFVTFNTIPSYRRQARVAFWFFTFPFFSHARSRTLSSLPLFQRGRPALLSSPTRSPARQSTSILGSQHSFTAAKRACKNNRQRSKLATSFLLDTARTRKPSFCLFCPAVTPFIGRQIERLPVFHA